MKIVINYQRSEYLNVLYDAVPIISVQRKTGELPSSQPSCGLFTKILIVTFGSIVFIFKKKKVGTCLFEFKEKAISRKSKSGDAHFELSQIDYILALSNSFLIDVGKGAMPVPYRCFNRDQKYTFEKMYKEKLYNFERTET